MSGKYYEELEVGHRIRHTLGRTVTETDNVLFNALTMNTQPLHLNADFASRTEFGQPIVNGMYTMPVRALALHPFQSGMQATAAALHDALRGRPPTAVARREAAAALAERPRDAFTRRGQRLAASVLGG